MKLFLRDGSAMMTRDGILFGECRCDKSNLMMCCGFVHAVIKVERVYGSVYIDRDYSVSRAYENSFTYSSGGAQVTKTITGKIVDGNYQSTTPGVEPGDLGEITWDSVCDRFGVSETNSIGWQLISAASVYEPGTGYIYYISQHCPNVSQGTTRSCYMTISVSKAWPNTKVSILVNGTWRRLAVGEVYQYPSVEIGRGDHPAWEIQYKVEKV